MSQKSWTFTSYEDGRPVETVGGLSDAEAIRAIERAARGVTPHVERREERDEQLVEQLAA